LPGGLCSSMIGARMQAQDLALFKAALGLTESVAGHLGRVRPGERIAARAARSDLRSLPIATPLIKVLRGPAEPEHALPAVRQLLRARRSRHRRGVPTSLDHRSRRQRPGTASQVRQDARGSLARGDPLASQPSLQRAARRPQLTDPGRQTPRPWVPHQPQLHHDDLPDRRQAQRRSSHCMTHPD
jgi:hypothetical protein